MIENKAIMTDKKNDKKFDIGKMIAATIEYRYFLLTVCAGREYRFYIYAISRLIWRV